MQFCFDTVIYYIGYKAEPKYLHFYWQIPAQWESTLVNWPKSEASSSTDSHHLNKGHLLVL